VHTPKTYVLTVYEAVAWSTTVLHLTEQNRDTNNTHLLLSQLVNNSWLLKARRYFIHCLNMNTPV